MSAEPGTGAELGGARDGAPGSADGLRRWAWLAAGAAAVAGGTLLGVTGGDLLGALARPPALVRAALVAAAVLVGLRVLGLAVGWLDAGRPHAGEPMTGRDVAVLIRGVRFVFLAVAVFAAAAGWLMGEAMPFVVALVIAGVDILETSFLMLVVAMRRDGDPG